MEFLELNTKEDLLLAQVSAEVRRSFVKNPKKVKVEDFLPRKRMPAAAEERLKQSKMAWVKSVGAKMENN